MAQAAGTRGRPPALAKKQLTQSFKEPNGDILTYIRVSKLLAGAWPSERLDLLGACLYAATILASPEASTRAIAEAKRALDEALADHDVALAAKPRLPKSRKSRKLR
jgi:hypothetical protein